MNEKEKHLRRRDFLKLSALSAISLGIPLKASTCNVSVPDDKLHDNYKGKDTRLTIAMWDFSWLTACHKGGAYENLEQRVAEASERGFNTLRIDCFPSRILDGRSMFKNNSTPGPQLPHWGQCAMDHEEDVLNRLTLLANACRKYNIMLGLDSWEKGHMIERNIDNPFYISKPIQSNEEEKTFRQFSQTWVKALKIMRDAGILERAVWVAPMNEVPHFGSGSVQFFKDCNSKAKNENEPKSVTENKIDNKYQQINHWIGEAIKDEISKDIIPLSYSSCGDKEYNKRLTDIYDIVDVHFMPDVIMNSEQKAALKKIEKGGGAFHYYENMDDLKVYSALWDNSCRVNYAAMLKRASNYFKTALNYLTLESGKKLQAIITESYGPCFWPDHKDVSWEWYKNYNADALRIAAGMPFTGLSLSNYSEPLFSLWDDVDWHRNSNLFTLNSL